MAVITISRQLGSGGATIAQLVAAELGFRLLDRELIDAVAVRMGVGRAAVQGLDEQTAAWANGLVQSLLLALQGHQLTQESYHYVADHLIREAASRESLVILGRGGQVVLASRPDALHVHVVAPVDDRVARISARDHIPAQEARLRIEASDEGRRRYVLAAGHRQWDDPLLYDLVVNTHRLVPEATAALVVDAARRAGVVK